MSQTTRPLPEVDEQLVASWPVGDGRAAARRAYRLMISTGSALEELLADVSTPELTAPYAEQPFADQFAHASRALLELRGMTGRADVTWSVIVPPRRWADEEVPELHGAVFGSYLPPGATARQETAAWAEVLDGGSVTETERSSGAVELIVRGSHLEVPVELSLYVVASEVAGGVL